MGKKKQQVNFKFLNNPTTYTYTHTPLKLISPSPLWTTFPFSAWKGVLSLIPMVPFRHWRLIRVSDQTPYFLVQAHWYSFVQTVQEKTGGQVSILSLCAPAVLGSVNEQHKVASKQDTLHVEKTIYMYLVRDRQISRTLQASFLTPKHPRGRIGNPVALCYPKSCVCVSLK